MSFTRLASQLLLLAQALSTFSCVHAENKRPENPSQTTSATPQMSPAAASDGKQYTKEAGWKPPDINSNWKKKTSTRKASVNVLISEFQPALEVLTEEPFASIPSSIKLIQINKVREYSANGRVFCYRIEATEAYREGNQSTVRGGMLFFFSYYDEDGDRRFENLVLDEVDGSGNGSFYSLPHLPSWLSNAK